MTPRGNAANRLTAAAHRNWNGASWTDPLPGNATKGFKYNPPATGNHYAYDAAGNMTTDNHKKTTITYNYLNLPTVITFTDGTNRKIEWVYDADGTKISKTTSTGVAVNGTKDYVGGIEYNGTNLEAIYFAEGRLTPNGAAFFYEYTIKDHLGNTRITFRANGASLTTLQENHYYPFGLEMEGTWQAQVGAENAYQYNGKELNEDFGLNWYDYGARWYDAAVGRWWSLDPLAEKSRLMSTYGYVGNNPMIMVDPTGMASEAYSFAYSSTEPNQQKNTKKAEGLVAPNDLPKPEIKENKSTTYASFRADKNSTTGSDILTTLESMQTIQKDDNGKALLHESCRGPSFPFPQ